MFPVFSSGKSLTAIVVAMAVDRGWLAYTDTIASHWPEFAQERVVTWTNRQGKIYT